MNFISTSNETEGNGMNTSLEHGFGSAIDRYMWMYASPVIYIPAVIGNFLTILVTLRHTFRKSSSGIYLATMAIAALCVLQFGLLNQWLEACRFLMFVELSPWTCRWQKFLYYAAGDVAIWTLVSFTLDRFIAVCYPLKKTKICTIQRATIAVVCIVVLACTKNFPTFWTRGAEYNETGALVTNCGFPTPNYKFYELQIRPWIVFTMVTVIPVSVILISNTLIVRTLVRADRTVLVRQSIRPSYRQTTLMCLSASFAFVLLMVPSIIIVLLKYYYSKKTEYAIAKAVNNLLVFVYYTASFFLYSLTGRKFRRELVVLFCCRARGLRSRSQRLGFMRRSDLIRMTSSSTSDRTSYLNINGRTKKPDQQENGKVKAGRIQTGKFGKSEHGAGGWTNSDTDTSSSAYNSNSVGLKLNSFAQLCLKTTNATDSGSSIEVKESCM